MKGRRVTIKDVAAVCGVTPQTVSRVFREQGYVSAETRKKVYDAADKLKYVPNTAAIMLRTGAVKSIAVVFDSLINVYFSVMVEYLQAAMQNIGYEITTIFARSHVLDKAVYRKAMSLGVRAVISFLEPDGALGDAVKDFGVPVLILGRRTELDGIDYITTDDVMGGELAAKKLIDCGCETCAYLAYGLDMTCVKDRFDGFRRVLGERGIEAGLIDCTDGVQSSLESYIEAHGVPDGIFCFSDMLAYEALKVAHKIGKSIKIIGYDNIQADIPMPIELTTIGVDKRNYVKLVVDSLLERIEGGSKNRICHSVQVKLHHGQTASV